MKKTPSPLIIRPGHIQKQKHSSGNQIIGNYTEKNDHKSTNPALSYIINAANRIRSFVSTIFFGHKKADFISSGDQIHSRTRLYQAEEDLYPSSSSGARGSRRSSRSWNSGYNASPEVNTASLTSSLTFKDIYKATDNFSPENIIGQGGYGTVYKGKLMNGTTVAVKRAKREYYDERISAEFKNEVLALSKIEHLNLVRFYGYVEHDNERLIVGEYVSNGTLRQHLDGKIHGSELEIGERFDIAIDVAHALTYLHTYTDPPIIHRDIKSSNILITEKLRAKVADFGFARLASEDRGKTHISTQIKGTTGYLDPEYLKTYQLTEKSDVYSFGVLLVEMMTGRHPIEATRSMKERVTTKWAMKSLRQGEVVVAMDPRLRRSVASIQAVENALKLARQCLAPSRLSRPSMRKCAEILWQIRREFSENNVNYKAATAAARSLESAEAIARRKRLQNVYGLKKVIA